MTDLDVWYELKLMFYLKEHGADKGIDIQRLRDTELRFFTPPLCYRVENAWLMRLRKTRRYDKWARRALSLQIKDPAARTLGRIDDIAEALEPRLQATKVPHERILHVPIDLADPVEDQLSDAQPLLTAIRQYLHRYTGQKIARHRPDAIWRDIYVYILAVGLERPVSEIADEVFEHIPKGHGRKRVRQIVGKVREALLAAGFSAPVSK